MTILKEEEYSKKIKWGIWKELLSFAKPHKDKFIRLGIHMTLLAGIDALFPLLAKYAIDNFAETRDIKGIIIFSAVYLILILIQVANAWFFIDYAGRINISMSYDIRNKGFKKLQELEFSYYDKTQVGWIMTRMTSDVQKLGHIFAWGLVDLVWGLTLMIIILSIMFIYSWKLALIVLASLPILIVISIIFQKKILKSYRKVRKANSKITGSVNESIMGAKTTKTLVNEENNLNEFKDLTNNMYLSSVKAAVLSSIYFPIILVLGSFGTGLILWLGGENVAFKIMTYGTLVAFISYTIQFFNPILHVAKAFAEFQNAQASAERVISMIETDINIKDSKSILDLYGDILSPKKENWPKLNGDIVFKNVDFYYIEGEQVLKNFNLNIKRGEKIALVGETGSGKSTIVNLICRFYEPINGEISIDGVNYKERSLSWLQSNLGYVLQTPHLFSGTIMQNIRYGNLDASDEEVKNAAKIVNADSFIDKLEQNYSTEVGEGGNRLSTGEKQLISFARAVLADPKIFILDEATSSIDTETEKIIQEAIDKVLKNRTSFIIAHRLSTIRSADRILVIKNGEIIEEGKHSQLIKEKGYYFKLYTNQFIDEEINSATK